MPFPTPQLVSGRTISGYTTLPATVLIAGRLFSYHGPSTDMPVLLRLDASMPATYLNFLPPFCLPASYLPAYIHAYLFSIYHTCHACLPSWVLLPLSLAPPWWQQNMAHTLPASRHWSWVEPADSTTSYLQLMPTSVPLF